jgi:hypothetical protein
VPHKPRSSGKGVVCKRWDTLADAGMLPYRPADDRASSTPTLPASAGCGCHALSRPLRPGRSRYGSWRGPLWDVAGPQLPTTGAASTGERAGGWPWCSSCHTATIRALSRPQTSHPLVARRPALRCAMRVRLQGPWRRPTMLPLPRRCEGRIQGGSPRGTHARLCPTPLCGSDPMAL